MKLIPGQASRKFTESNPNLMTPMENFVSLILEKNLDGRFTYHNLSHTIRVVKYVINLSGREGLDKGETEVAIIAAWFHDTGFAVKYIDHEDESIRIASDFLSSVDFPSASIDNVKECIAATRNPSSPGTPIQNIVHDADYCHLFEPDYFELVSRLRQELNTVMGKVFTDKQWWEWNLEFLKQHVFFTSSLKELWNHNRARIIGENERILKALN
jgi:predicted metal-dependent HD superfamily phosphohydrolase